MRVPRTKRSRLCGCLLALLAAAVLGSGAGCRTPTTDREKREAIETMYRRYRESFPDIPDLTAAELAAIPRAQRVLVDVRTPAERAVSVIPGAIPADQFERDRAKYKGRKIVTYCTIGYRSGLYAERLKGTGLQASTLKGGILSWAHAGLEIVDENGPTRRVHVYGRKWSLLPDSYEPVW